MIDDYNYIRTISVEYKTKETLDIVHAMEEQESFSLRCSRIITLID